MTPASCGTAAPVSATVTHAQPSQAATPVIRPDLLASADLLRGKRLVEISHNGEVYRLHATRHGKLILTK